MAVAVEIPQKREASTRQGTKEEENGDQRIRDTEEKRKATGLNASQHATTEGADNTLQS